MLTFDRYTLDLNMLRDAPGVRFRDAQERYLGELFWPPPQLDPMTRRSFLVEGHQRLVVPLSVFSFVMIPLACLLPGEFNRRGQLQRVLLAVGLAFVFQAVDLGIKNLANRNLGLVPLMYVIDLLPLALGFGDPAVRRDQARLLAPGAGGSLTGRDSEAFRVHPRRTLSAYIARQFVVWFGGGVRHDGQRDLPARLHRADPARRHAGAGDLGHAAARWRR